MGIQTYRSATLPSRSLYTVSTNDSTFCVLEDLAVQSDTSNGQDHPRSTFVTVSSPQNIASMLLQISGRWSTSRQGASSNGEGGKAGGGGGHLLIDGFVFSIGKDWIVRVAKVTQAGGAGLLVKGIVIEVSFHHA